MTTLIPKFDFKNGSSTPAGAINRPINQKLAEIVSVMDFGAVGNGTTDDTAAIQAAIDSITAGTPAVILFPSGTYLISNTITSKRGIELRGEFAILNCWTITSGLVIQINDASPNVTPTPCVTGMKFIGKQGAESVTTGSPYIYTAGLVALNISTHHVTVSNCGFVGFDKCVTFGNNSYVNSFYDCYFGFSNYGIYFTVTGFTNLGENIAFYHCTVGNTNYGIYNNVGELNFTSCSIDYNRYNHISANNSLLGGQLRGSMSFVTCHFECTSTQNPDTTRINNNGLISFQACSFLDDYAGYFITTATNGSVMYLSDCFFEYGQNGKYIISQGNTRIIAKGITYLSDSDTTLLSPVLCNIKNNGAESGDLTGWTQVYGTCTASTTKKNNGTYSFKMVGATFNNAAMSSNKAPIQSNAKYMCLNLYVNTSQVTGTNTAYLYTYDVSGTQLDAFTATITGSGSNTFSFITSGWQFIDPRATTFAVYINTGSAGTSEIAYVDDVNVQFQ